MEIHLCDATDADLTVVSNLVRFYVYDMSRHTGWRCPDDGLFGGCDDLPKYWRVPGNKPLLIKSGDELAGFVMLDANPSEPDVDYRVGEFFVLGKFRRRGVGARVAREIFDRFRGRWVVEALRDNTPAVAFWRSVIDGYTRGRFTESVVDSKWGPQNVFAFRSE